MSARHHMVHPGPVHPKRVEWARSRIKRIERTTGAVGESLEQAIAALVATSGASSGNGTFSGMALSRTRFTTGGPARDGKAANYTFIRDWDARTLSQGTFTFGIDTGGKPFVHCHAVINNPAGGVAMAGHLFPKDCVLAGSFDITLLCLPDIRLVQSTDAETLHSVFDVHGHAMDGPALFVRVRPNEDICTAVELACAQAGLTDGVIMPSIGSLNAPMLNTGRYSSVGMEVIALRGTLAKGAVTLQAHLCDEAGTLHEGQLVNGGASVCVTAEVVICERRQPLPVATP